MSVRFFSKGEVFEPLDLKALYETTYEKIVADSMRSFFPSIHVIPFKKTIYNDFSSSVPDLMFIDNMYREWWIVEVELIDHSLNGHVLEQVRVFTTGKYDSSTVEYILSKDSSLDREKLELMIKGDQPKVIVIANKHSDAWSDRLRDFGAIFMSIEVFESMRGNRTAMLNGSLPSLGEKTLSRVTFVPSTKAIKVGSPASLYDFFRKKEELSEAIHISLNGYVSFWKPIEIKNEVWLVPVNTSPLDRKKRYKLVTDEMGEFMFEEEQGRSK